MKRSAIASIAGAILLGLALALGGRAAAALEGFRCQHSSQCSAHELRVADDLASTWGTCRKLRVLR